MSAHDEAAKAHWRELDGVPDAEPDPQLHVKEEPSLEAQLAAVTKELDSLEWCAECGGILTACGPQGDDGTPTTDCRVCQLKSSLAAMTDERDELADCSDLVEMKQERDEARRERDAAQREWEISKTAWRIEHKITEIRTSERAVALARVAKLQAALEKLRHEAGYALRVGGYPANAEIVLRIINEAVA